MKDTTSYDAVFHKSKNLDLVAESIQPWFEFMRPISIRLAATRIKKIRFYGPSRSWDHRVVISVLLTRSYSVTGTAKTLESLLGGGGMLQKFEMFMIIRFYYVKMAAHHFCYTFFIGHAWFCSDFIVLNL